MSTRSKPPSYKQVFEAIRTALSAETARRTGRSLEQWILAERSAVLIEVNYQRHVHALDPIDLADVERAELKALGHADYVSKYAHAAAALVFA